MSRNRSSDVAVWLVMGMIALIAYGSLYPFNLKSGNEDLSWWRSLLEAFGQLSWARAGLGDRIANILLYVPLGFCLALWFDGANRHRAAVITAVACGGIFSLSIEVAQVYISTRVPSLLDVTLNTCGTFLGGIGGVAWRALSARLPSSLAGARTRDERAPLIILFLWFAWRWSPFVPHFTLSKLKLALQPLFDPQVTLIASINYLIWWVVVAQTIFVLTSAQRGVEMLLVAIAAMLVGRLFVVDLAFIPSELIALVLLLPVLVVLHRLWAPSRRLIVLCAFAAACVFERLAPFSLSSSGAHFDLWPFLAWIDTGMPLHLQSVFKLMFEYAALMWLIRETGTTTRFAIWTVPISVLALEVLALWMPGRDGSLTAPALACGVAFAMRYAMTDAHATPQLVRSR